MLRKMLYRKITVASSILLVILMLYLIPTSKEETIPQNLEYIYPNDLETIYLLDSFDYVSMSKINTSNKDIISRSMDLLDGLTLDGKKQDKIPSGFRSLIPPNTKVLDIKLSDKILTINFSKEFNEINAKYEEKIIEAITYTLTSINGIDKIEIFIEGQKLIQLPHSKKMLPVYLDKSYGINKKYDLSTLSDIDSYTIYYINSYNDETYYTPVTKYINNDSKDKIKIIIDELSSSLVYESNLMTYLNNNVKLLDYKIIDDTIKLNFNDYILSDVTNNVILEEVMYTIGMSMCDELNLEKVVFEVNNKEISTFSLK